MPTTTPAKTQLLWLGENTSAERNLAAALRLEGYEVSLTSSCRHAVEIIRAHVAALLVLDVDFHCKELQHLTPRLSVPNPPCRWLAIAQSLEQLELASNLAAHMALIKPLDPIQLARALNKLLLGMRLPAWVPPRLLDCDACGRRDHCEQQRGMPSRLGGPKEHTYPGPARGWVHLSHKRY
jgi:DNA-binding response OmpR family regulator